MATDFRKLRQHFRVFFKVHCQVQKSIENDRMQRILQFQSLYLYIQKLGDGINSLVATECLRFISKKCRKVHTGKECKDVSTLMLLPRSLVREWRSFVSVRKRCKGKTGLQLQIVLTLAPISRRGLELSEKSKTSFACLVEVCTRVYQKRGKKCLTQRLSFYSYNILNVARNQRQS